MSLEREDYIMRQIVQLGQALANMIARLINLKQVPDAGLSLDEIKQIYRDELDLSLDLVQQTPAEDLIELLKTDLKFFDQHLEQMAEILSETADLLEINPTNMDVVPSPKQSAIEQSPTKESSIEQVSAKQASAEQARELRQKSILILEHLQESTGAYSFERAAMISSLRERIGQHN